MSETESRAIETRYTREPICPYCGHAVSDAWECDIDEYGTVMECSECEKEFSCRSDIDITYITSKNTDGDCL